EELPDMYNIFPAQAPVKTDDSGREISFVKQDAETYTSSKPYPTEDVKLGEQNDLAGQAMIPVTIYPLCYMPKQKTLSLVTGFSIICVDALTMVGVPSSHVIRVRMVYMVD
ncbi:unnamed protein product, partial [marine sediment metagenome]